MRITRKAAFAAVAATSVLALAACSSGGGSDDATDDAGINTETSVNIAWNQPFYSANGNSTTGNATANNVILYMLNSGFWYYDQDLNLVQDKSFGTYEKVSDDPLQVKYTFADTAKWSDGTAAGPADLLLEWAAQSGKFNNVEAEYDEEGNITNQDALDAGVYFDAASPAMALVEETPEIDGDSITLTYTKPFADWSTAISMNLPAHVVAQRALGIEDAQEATDALVAAITDGNVEDLSPIAKSWSTDWNFASMPSDEDLLVTSGAYQITEFEQEQFITLTANPDYEGDHKAVFNKVTVRYNGDPMGQVQAPQNGEVDLINPQATADVKTAVEAIDGLKVESGPEGTYEHVDLQFANGGPFDPATYGGDAEKALAVRTAFLTAIPRQTIVDNLIVPLNPKAEVRNSFIDLPGSPNYDDMVANNGSDAYPLDADVAKAKQILADAGITTPVPVRFAFNGDNPRRQNEFALISDPATQAGFQLIDASAPATEWGTKLSSQQSEYDASLFGWQSESTAVTESEANYRTGGINNYGHYSNSEVDGLFDKLAVSIDPEEQAQLQLDVEKQLWADAFGTTIFQFPGIHAWNDKLEGPAPISINPTIFYGFWDWKIEATTPTDEATS